MDHPPPLDRRTPLLDQLDWFVRLRWVAGATVIIAALVDFNWLHAVERPGRLVAVGIALLACNLGYALALPRLRKHPRQKVALDAVALLQVGLDLALLTLLTLWTGALQSPLLGFFVFHMLFASLLLPRFMAYGAMGQAVVLMAVGLHTLGAWPTTRGEAMVLGGWILTLLFTVYLTSTIASRLKQQQRRLIRQNRQIRRIGRRLQQQQQAMIQHEKMIAMGTLAAGVAHEIANPLASMDSLLQLMQRNPDKPRPGALGTLRTQVERIGGILRQMNNFSHPVDVQWQRLPVAELLEQSVAILRFDKRTKGVALETTVAPDAGEVSVQAQAIQQVLVNLLINAVDAVAQTPAPRIVVAGRREGDQVVLEVADNGPGVPAGVQARIFEPFYTTKPVGKGTGLGLSISYKLVQSHGGTISVQNHPDGGAVFRVMLPAQGSQPSAAGMEPQAPTPAAEPDARS